MGRGMRLWRWFCEHSLIGFAPRASSFSCLSRHFLTQISIGEPSQDAALDRKAKEIPRILLHQQLRAPHIPRDTQGGSAPEPHPTASPIPSPGKATFPKPIPASFCLTLHHSSSNGRAEAQAVKQTPLPAGPQCLLDSSVVFCH